MMIQSVTKTITSTRVVVLGVPVAATQADVLAFVNMAPRGFVGDVTFRSADDFSGEVAGKSANITFWTD